MYKVSETVLPIYINGQCPIIKTCSDVTLNLSSKDSSIALQIEHSSVFFKFYMEVTSFVNLLCFLLSCVCYAFVRVCLYVPCGHLLGKGWTTWLSFVVSNCEFVTFPLVSLFRCDT